MTTEQPEPQPDEPEPTTAPETPAAIDNPERSEGAATGDDTSPNKEAAKYRRKLREAEKDRDRLAGIVAAHQRTEAERLASRGMRALADGADLWAVGVNIEDLLDEDGTVDAAKVRIAVDGLLEARPHWAGSSSPDGGPRGDSPPPTPDLAELMRARLGR